MKRMISIVLSILMLAAMIALIFSAIHLYQNWKAYQKGTDTYQELSSSFVERPEDKKPAEDKPDNPKPDTLQIDFAGLQAMNPDIIGWIEIPGLSINYPVLQGKDNAYYLTHLADRKYGISGSIFMDYHNVPDFSDSNTIIYGHNMKDKSMFGTLDRYKDSELYEENPYFYIYTPGKRLTYQIFSCYAGHVGSDAYLYEFPEAEDFNRFLQQIQSYAAYDTGKQVMETERVVTLSTCTNTSRDYRYLVHGVLIKEEKN